MDGDGYINYWGLVDPTNYYYDSRIACVADSDMNLKRYDDGSYIQDDDPDNDGILPSDDPDDDNDGMSDTYEYKYGRYNGGWQDVWIYNGRYGIIYCGNPKGKEKGEPWPAFWNDGKQMYKVLVDNYKWLDENIYLLKYGAEAGYVDGVYVDGNVSLLYDSIGEIAEISTLNDLFFFIEISHGDENGFDSIYSYSWLDSKIDYAKGLGIQGNRKIIVLVNCRSGGGIDDLSGENRIVITSAKIDEESWMADDYPPYDRSRVEFLWNDENNGFVYALTYIYPISLYDAYKSGYDAAQDWPRTSTPQLYDPEDMAKSTYL
mgnify:CR=1 FL=1